MMFLLRVADGAYSDMALDAALNRSTLEQRDKRLVTELVYGVLRLRGRIDFALTQFCDRPLTRLQAEVLWLLRLGAYQLLELDRVPDHAAVNSTIELAKELQQDSATGFINAILRSLIRERNQIPWPDPGQIKNYLQHECSLPVWLSKEIMRQMPNHDARLLGESLKQPPPLSLRVNTLKIDRAAYLDKLQACGHEVRIGDYAPEAVMVERRGEQPLPGNAEGWYQVQDEASMMIPHLLDVRPGQRILDACAAPGGKTTQIAALTGNDAEIIALEKYPQRVELIQQGAERLGCSSIATRQWDLLKAPDFLEPRSFDRVLMDAPCSGLGVIRRNPEGRWNKGPASLKELAVLQQAILKNVAGLVRPGGKLLYSVCTFSHSETDRVVALFLEEHPHFVLEDLKRELPSEWHDLLTEQGTLRSYPHRHGGMDAFYAARFEYVG
jgi:16S rRNA (cytosine967-C5)-methyltransferase